MPMNPIFPRRGPASAALILAATVVLSARPAAAQTWTGAVSGSWQTAGNWSPATVPASSADTVLSFGAATNTAMTTSSFNVNRLDFAAGGPAYSLAPGGFGSPINFFTSSGGVAPQIVMDTDSNVTFTLLANLLSNFTVAGTGSGTLALGAVGGSGSLTMA